LCYDKEAEEKGLVYVAPKDHRISKKDSRTYNQLLEVFHQYTNLTQMAYCNYPFNTQNQVISTVALKDACYSRTISLFSCIAISIGIHNYGRVQFMSRLFRELGIEMTTKLMQFLARKEKRKQYKKNMMRGWI